MDNQDNRDRQSKKQRKLFHLILDFEQAYGTTDEKRTYENLVHFLNDECLAANVHGLFAEIQAKKKEYEALVKNIENSFK